ncbi:MAG: FAD binding domain-containing protein [bacterium JZ-2024 1]
MLRLPPFHLLLPHTLEELMKYLEEYPEATILAGGTDTVPAWKRGERKVSVVIALSRISELKRCYRDERGAYHLGPMVTLSEIAQMSLWRGAHAVRIAAGSVASPAIRNMATLGGNLCQDTRCVFYNEGELWREAVGNCKKTVSDICRVAPGGNRCWATYHGDLAPALMVFLAEIQISSPSGTRKIPLEQLYLDDGISPLNLKSGEILTDIVLPGENSLRTTYVKLRPREEIDFPEVGVAVAVKISPENRFELARLALTGVACTPVRVYPAEEFLMGKPVEDEILRHTGEIVQQNLHPMATSYFTPLYKKKMAEVLTYKALSQVCFS